MGTKYLKELLSLGSEDDRVPPGSRAKRQSSGRPSGRSCSSGGTASRGPGPGTTTRSTLGNDTAHGRYLCVRSSSQDLQPSTRMLLTDFTICHLLYSWGHVLITTGNRTSPQTRKWDSDDPRQRHPYLGGAGDFQLQHPLPVLVFAVRILNGLNLIEVGQMCGLGREEATTWDPR